MVDPRRLWHPGMGSRIKAMLESGVDPNSYEISAATLRKLIRECESGSDSLKRKMLNYVERKAIKGRTTVPALLLGKVIADFTKSVEDEDVLKIAEDLRDLNNLPYVRGNGRSIS